MAREVADLVYARIRDLLEVMPEAFLAVQDGLVLPIEAIDEHVCFDMPRSLACSAAVADGYLLRATWDRWFFLPEALGVDNEWLPSGIIDCRHVSARDVMCGRVAA